MPLEGPQGLAGVEGPDAQRVVSGPRDGAAAVGSERDGGDPGRVPIEGPQGLPGVEVPDAQRPVIGRRDGAAAIGGDGDGPDPGRVPLEGAQGPPGVEVPDAQRPVSGRRDGAAAIGGDGDGGDNVRVPLEGAQERPPWRGEAGGQRPHPQVMAAASDGIAKEPADLRLLTPHQPPGELARKLGAVMRKHVRGKANRALGHL